MKHVHREAGRLAALLRKADRKIVFAESCTGGLISAAMTAIPGISAFYCGSAVVYQVETKHHWLGVPEATLEKPGPVSRETAVAMAEGVLRITPHADLAASVTGHLGPKAPKRQDGLFYSAVAVRSAGGGASCRRVRLEPPEGAADDRRLRLQRRKQAAARVLGWCADVVQSLIDAD